MNIKIIDNFLNKTDFRNLKNKWPICECKQPMRVHKNADTPVSTSN